MSPNIGSNKYDNILTRFPRPETITKGDTPKAIDWLKGAAKAIEERNWNTSQIFMPCGQLSKRETSFVIDFLKERGWEAKYIPVYDQRDVSTIAIKLPEQE